ncbi:MAG: hypothetical protein RL428_199 [Actinomycetota bacterium]
MKIRAALIALALLTVQSVFSSPAVAAPLATPSTTCTTSCITNFAYQSANYYTWTVPRSDTFTLELWGAQGGGGANFYGAGGAGGYVKGDIYLTSGTVLYLYVGQAGVRYNSGSTTAYNGGGAGNPNDGYSGGGATHIATAVGTLSTLSSSQSTVLAVAGGGGGGAGSSSNYGVDYSPAGGVGGGLTGGNPVDSGQASIRGKGLGGTQSAGGATGLANDAGYDLPAVASAFGLGASVNTYVGDAIQGGGGGGGWYGGGAGSHRGGAGGGGSSYVSRLSSVTNSPGNVSIVNPDGTTTTGRQGAGYIRISYSVPVAASLQSLSFSGSVSKGQLVAMTAAFNAPGRVRFFANEKRIPGCLNISTSGSGPYSAVCNWRPASSTLTSIKIEFTSSSGGFLSGVFTPDRIAVKPRSNRR